MAARWMRSGEQVAIRAPGRTDAREIVAAVRATRALHRPYVYAPETPEAFVAYLARLRDGRHAGVIVVRREDGALCGVVNANEIVRGALQSAYLGYYALGSHAGRGYMREGLALVVDELMGPMRLHRVEANIQPGNARSIALVRGLGFSREGFSPRYLKVGGRWRDHERWALTREVWRARHRSRESLLLSPRAEPGGSGQGLLSRP